MPKTTLIPLDVTHQVLATPEVLRLMLHGTEPTHRTTPSTLRQMLHDLLTFFAHTYAEVFGLVQGPPLHDPLAVAAIFPDHSEHGIHFDDRGGERWAVEVVTDGLHSDVEEERGQVGRTRVSKAQDGEVGVRIPRGLNVQGLWSLLEGCVKRAEERSLQEVDHAADFR